MGAAVAVVMFGGTSTPAFALVAPSGLSATAASSTSIALRWTDTNPNETGYSVERSLSPSSGFKRVKALGANATSYTDSGLTPSTTYYYRVVTKGTSRRSNVASATTAVGGGVPTPRPTVQPTPTPRPQPTATPRPTATPDAIPPSVPSGVSGSAPACDRVNLTWTPSVDSGGSGISGYRVFRNGVSNMFVTASAASDTNVNGGAVYSYAIAAVDNAGNQSAPSSALALNTPPCTGPSGPWAKRIGGTAGDFAQAVAVDGAGNIVVTGMFAGSANFGGTQVSSAGGTDVFVAKYTAPGAHAWSKRFGSSGDEIAQAVAVDGSGAVYVAGYFWSSATDFGSGTLSNAGPNGTSDIFVAKYSAAGQPLWSKRFGGTDADSANGIAVDPSGDVLITGVFKGANIDFAGRALSSSWGGPDTFVVKLDGATGANVWAKNPNCGGPDIGYGIAVDQAGNVFVVGSFAGNADFGAGGWMTTAGNNDVYLAKYSSSGAYVWAKRFGSTSQDNGVAVAVDGSGNVAITGNFFGTVDFGGAPLSAAQASTDAFAAKYSASGAHLWSKRYGDYNTDYGLGVAADEQGNVVVSGSFIGTTNFGGGSLTSATNTAGDAFVVAYNASGAHLWSERFGASGNEWAQSVAFGPQGPVASGFFSGTVNFSGASLTAAGLTDGFILNLGE